MALISCDIVEPMINSAMYIWLLLLMFGRQQPDPYRAAREEMVRSQIEYRGVDNPAVLSAMRKVPRHFLVPESQQAYAYGDYPMQIGHRQTISQPYIVGYMTAAIDPKPTHRVLEIGTGSGYQAAVLAEIVKQVYTIEIIPELGALAADRLRSLGYKNIEVRVSDGYHGWPEEAPFDAIVVTAAAPEVPAPLIEQLAEGGKMIIPVGPEFSVQNLVLVTRRKGRIEQRQLFSVRFVPFTRE